MYMNCKKNYASNIDFIILERTFFARHGDTALAQWTFSPSKPNFISRHNETTGRIHWKYKLLHQQSSMIYISRWDFEMSWNDVLMIVSITSYVNYACIVECKRITTYCENMIVTIDSCCHWVVLYFERNSSSFVILSLQLSTASSFPCWAAGGWLD